MARGGPLLRQWNLLKALQSHRFGITADELAERVDCSKRQVQRDLRVLADAGFPISFDSRDFGQRFWRLTSHFVEREQLMLSLTEILSLVLGQRLMAPLSGTQLGSGLSEAMAKIKALLPARTLDHFSDLDRFLCVKTLGVYDYSRKSREIEIINRAISLERVLKIRYRAGAKGVATERRFCPYGLALVEGSLYCVGFCQTRRELRTLKVTRLDLVEMTDEEFTRPSTFSLEAYMGGTFGAYSARSTRTVTVRFDGWAALSVREGQWHPSQEMLEETEERCTVRFRLSDLTEFKRWLMGYGRHAVVQSPAELAAEVRAEHVAAIDAYAHSDRGTASKPDRDKLAGQSA